MQDPGARVWLFKALAIMTVKRAGLSRWAGLHCDVTRLCYSWVIYMKLGDPSNAAQGYPQCCSLFFFLMINEVFQIGVTEYLNSNPMLGTWRVQEASKKLSPACREFNSWCVYASYLSLSYGIGN